MNKQQLEHIASLERACIMVATAMKDSKYCEKTERELQGAIKEMHRQTKDYMYNQDKGYKYDLV